MCEDENEPLCVKWCLAKALTYEERDEEREEEPQLGELDTGLEALVNRHGLQKVIDTVARLSKKG
jgi:benzoyl-CoA reductase subunit BamC